MMRSSTGCVGVCQPRHSHGESAPYPPAGSGHEDHPLSSSRDTGGKLVPIQGRRTRITGLWTVLLLHMFILWQLWTLLIERRVCAHAENRPNLTTDMFHFFSLLEKNERMPPKFLYIALRFESSRMCVFCQGGCQNSDSLTPLEQIYAHGTLFFTGMWRKMLHCRATAVLQHSENRFQEQNSISFILTDVNLKCGRTSTSTNPKDGLGTSLVNMMIKIINHNYIW